MVRVLALLHENNRAVDIPLYDQTVGDIHGVQHVCCCKCDIIIIEGINVLKPCRTLFDRTLLSDFLDFSMFVDAPTSVLRGWFYNRLLEKRATHIAFGHDSVLIQQTNKQVKDFANHIWQTVNQVNLDNNIEPYKHRANVRVMHRSDHSICAVHMRV